MALNNEFKRHWNTREPFVRVVKALLNGENGEDFQPQENLLFIPPDGVLPMEELQLHAQRFGWPENDVTLLLAHAELPVGAGSSYITQSTLRRRGGAPMTPRPAPAPQAPAQAPSNPADSLAGLSDVQQLKLEVTKLAAMASGGRRASVLDRILSGELQPDEVMIWMGNIQKFANFGKVFIEHFVKWIVPLVIRTAENARADAAKNNSPKNNAPRSPEAAPPPT
jgi:hypothetical protein